MAEAGKCWVLRDVVHISLYRQHIYYVGCSLQYINKYTITVFINKTNLFIYYYVCIHNEYIHNHLFIIITNYCNNLLFIFITKSQLM